ncbi:hypothetical protein MANES_15G187022v8 [Manihot esculenta]|uniref:Uncharacterized protein n=1 Tax=Manihot esculenta TaxID=3983 RepID=A0ACB7GDV2_MANES|nr:hypothetical protein MANES_15G187022v8 [Manihot esculenta]
MHISIYFSLTSLLLLFVFVGRVQPVVFDVNNYGGKADGNAWKEACSATGSNRVVVPKGTYSIGLTDLNGPCKGAMELQVRGTLVSPINPSEHTKDNWIIFAYIDRFTLSGGGTFDGQGQVAWKQNNCGRNPKCKRFPVSLWFDFITNSVIQNILKIFP